MPARIISRAGPKFLVEDLEEKVYCTCRKKLPPLAVGDYVKWQMADEESGVITDLIERKNILQRPDPFNQFNKPIAANIDFLLIVVAPKPKVDWSLVDKYLVVARNLKVEPIIVLNKKDSAGFSELATSAAHFGTIDYHILSCSTRDQYNLQAIEDLTQNKTCILVGQSGVGKSSIINALLPDEKIRVSGLSNNAGKHTTSNSTMYFLKNQGKIIDSPGVREFGLWQLGKNEIASGFVEIQAKSSECHFHNCRHISEPKCAVKQAVVAGEINSRRYASYQELILDNV